MRPKDYLDDAERYDTFLRKSKIYRIGDKILLDTIKQMSKKITNPVIIEPGCGTGIMTEKIAKIRNATVVGVDPSKVFMVKARKRLNGYRNVRLMKKDAVSARITDGDICTMRFVYHHIADAKKYSFMKNMYRNLKRGGQIIILDEFLPFYRSKKEWKKNLIRFHDNKKKIALSLEDPSTAKCEDESKMLGLIRKGEYKVHLKKGIGDVKKAGFKDIKTKMIKHPFLKDSGKLGMYLITARK